MCLRARKTKRYGQRVPIVSYYVGSLAASCSNFDLCFKQALQFQKPKTKGRQIWPPPWAAKGPATPLVSILQLARVTFRVIFCINSFKNRDFSSAIFLMKRVIFSFQYVSVTFTVFVIRSRVYIHVRICVTRPLQYCCWAMIWLLSIAWPQKPTPSHSSWNSWNLKLICKYFQVSRFVPKILKILQN